VKVRVKSEVHGDVGGTSLVLPRGVARGDDGPMVSRREYCPIACAVDVLVTAGPP